jgi:segregation and condensation protein B
MISKDHQENDTDTDVEATPDEDTDASETTADEGREGVSDAEADALVRVPVSESADAALPEHRELSAEEMDYFRGLLEAVIFMSTEPISLSVLAKRSELDRVNARILVDSLIDDYAERDSGIALREIAGGYQFITSEKYSPAIKEIFKEQKRETLSRATLETLAIISYRQPITLPEIDEVRGVNSRAMVTQLLQRKLIKPQGYRPVPGRPTLYVTSRSFLSHFALNSLSDLPALEEVKELKFDDLD